MACRAPTDIEHDATTPTPTTRQPKQNGGCDSDRHRTAAVVLWIVPQVLVLALSASGARMWATDTHGVAAYALVAMYATQVSTLCLLLPVLNPARHGGTLLACAAPFTILGAGVSDRPWPDVATPLLYLAGWLGATGVSDMLARNRPALQRILWACALLAWPGAAMLSYVAIDLGHGDAGWLGGWVLGQVSFPTSAYGPTISSVVAGASGAILGAIAWKLARHK